jgi:molybdopterin molybdotransferase
MLAVEEAQERVLAPLAPTPVEWLALPQAAGRVLADDLRARRDQPPVAVSAMDGYAVRAADTAAAGPGRRFRLVGEAAAGGPGAPALGPGEAARTFPGGALPPGADAVVIQENAAPDGDGGVRFDAAVTPGTFVRPAGLDFARGWIGLAAGTPLDPRALGLAAALGHLWLPVRRRPRVGLLATGDELRWPGETPEGSQIHSSNSVTLAAMLARWGAQPVDLGICPDDAPSLAARLREAAGLDMLVTSGGASVGDHDLVQRVLGREGLRLDFWKVAMRPGKPLLHGRLGEVPVLGFPGNPVSTAVCAIVFLRAALQRLCGMPVRLRRREAALANVLGPNDRRQDYLRASYEPEASEGRVRTAERQDSSMLATFARADTLVVRPPLDPARGVGEIVRVIDLSQALDNLR